MDAARPNHNMVRLAEVAVAIAARQSRHATIEFLFKQGCTPGTIALILAAGPTARASIGATPTLTPATKQNLIADKGLYRKRRGWLMGQSVRSLPEFCEG